MGDAQTTSRDRLREGWNPITFDHVIASFLRGEAHRFESLGYHPTEEERLAVESSDLSNPVENRLRMRLLYSNLKRGAIFARVPDDTDWYEIRLREEDLPRLLILPVMAFLHVASRGVIPLRDEPEDWERPILWGHVEDGPFTILEGNRRLIAHVQARGRRPLDIPVYVGLSDNKCRWHLPDWYKIQS